MKKRLLIKIKSKLYSNSGASLVLALLFFAMCAMVGSVVLTAGSATAGRSLKLASETQEQYTLESAARVLAKILKGYTFSFTHSVSSSLDPESIDVLPTASSSKFGDAICKALISKVYKNQWEKENGIFSKVYEDDIFPIRLEDELSTSDDSYEMLLDSSSETPAATITLTEVDPEISTLIKPVKVDVFYNGYNLGVEFTVNKTLSLGLDVVTECNVSDGKAYVEFTFSNPTITSGKEYSKSVAASPSVDEGLFTG